MEINYKTELNNAGIKQDAIAADHYRALADDRPLTPAEQRRLDNLEASLERKYAKQQMLEQVEQRLKEVE